MEVRGCRISSNLSHKNVFYGQTEMAALYVPEVNRKILSTYGQKTEVYELMDLDNFTLKADLDFLVIIFFRGIDLEKQIIGSHAQPLGDCF